MSISGLYGLISLLINDIYICLDSKILKKKKHYALSEESEI